LSEGVVKVRDIRHSKRTHTHLDFRCIGRALILHENPAIGSSLDSFPASHIPLVVVVEYLIMNTSAMFVEMPWIREAVNLAVWAHKDNILTI
jgi:hypothetical protein